MEETNPATWLPLIPVPCEDTLPAPAADSPYQRTYESERRRILARVFYGLKPQHQLVIRLYYGRGLTFEQIGSQLGLEKCSVQQKHARILANMREDLRRAGISSLRAFL